jgi:hypothetical protein
MPYSSAAMNTPADWQHGSADLYTDFSNDESARVTAMQWAARREHCPRCQAAPGEPCVKVNLGGVTALRIHHCERMGLPRLTADDLTAP